MISSEQSSMQSDRATAEVTPTGLPSEAIALEKIVDGLPELRLRFGNLAEEALKSALQQPGTAWKVAITPYALAMMLGMDAFQATPEKMLALLQPQTVSELLAKQTAYDDSNDENFRSRFADLCYQLWEDGSSDEYIRTVSAILGRCQSREAVEGVGRAIFLAGCWKGWKLREQGEVSRGSVN